VRSSRNPSERLGRRLGSTDYKAVTVLNVATSGLFVGLIYGLLGVGFVVVYRGSRVVNFAYGESGMVAAMLFADMRFGSRVGGFGPPSTVDHGVLIALPVAVLVAAVLGGATELFVARPLRSAPRVQVLVGTLAVGALLFTFAADHWGTDARFIKPIVQGDGVRLGSIQVSPEQLLIAAVSVVVLIALAAIYRFTPFGMRMRATALDPYAAGLLGVNVNATSMATWALAGGLAGLSAILIAPLGAFNIAFMITLTVRGLAAALVGGLTSIMGAFTAGMLLGIAEAVIAFKTPISGVTDLVIALCVLLVLFVRPSGLFRSAY
jgi:branched-chain amino acid transport system permease protein